jgi:predicted PurR-regulated permease PerM
VPDELVPATDVAPAAGDVVPVAAGGEPLAATPTPGQRVLFDPRNIWKVGLVVIALVAVALFGRFVVDDGGSVIFTLLIAFFASMAIEPAVVALSRHMRRGAATGLVMLAAALAIVLFMLAFGKLIADQLVQAVQALPVFAQHVLDKANEALGTNYTAQQALEAVGITQDKLATWGREVAGGVVGLVVSIVGAVFSSFTFVLFTFYFSADAPRLKRYVARLFAPRYQPVVVTVWDLAVQKTGGYVAARVILATINGATTALFLFIIGMDYWLVLGIWTGVVAQFVPTIGTYISIALPVLVGLVGPHPIQGVLALGWAIVYQQVENLTLEPKISAKAVNIHPAVSFAAVMMGAALFGAAGAILAIPVAALILALLDIYGRKYELLPSIAAPAPALPPEPADHPRRRRLVGSRTHKDEPAPAG